MMKIIMVGAEWEGAHGLEPGMWQSSGLVGEPDSNPKSSLYLYDVQSNGRTIGIGCQHQTLLGELYAIISFHR